MKVLTILFGVLLTTAASAQERMATQPSRQAPPVNVARDLQVVDPQIAQLKQQIVELNRHQAVQQAQISELKVENAVLAYCLGKLKAELKELKSPTEPGDSVKVQQPQVFGAPDCG